MVWTTKFFILLGVLISVCAANVYGQNRCFTPEEAKRIIQSVDSPNQISDDGKIRRELLKMREERFRLNDKIASNVSKNQQLIPEANAMGERHLLRVCQIVRESGWLGKNLLRDDGIEALTYLIASNKSFHLQREFLPILSEAAKKSYIKNSLLASLVDNIRVSSGLLQIFGTYATVRDNVIYLYPLLNEKKVDEWRRLYDLPPLSTQIRSLENIYLLPLVKIPRSSLPIDQKAEASSSDTSALGLADSENEIIKVETKLVNLNVRVLASEAAALPDLKLSKDDFAILENDVEQEIRFFSTTEQPFDLVLLLDFSGSTVDKRGLIKKAAQRFVEYARPSDRIAVVVFAGEIKIVSELTSDKNALVQKIKNVDANGSSPIWDSLQFTYQNIINQRSAGRRSSIVFMTDGEDNSTKTTFADVLETVRRNETTIFSVCLDNDFSGRLANRIERRSQRSLRLLAEQSGGQFYQADSVNDLKGIYEQVIDDLGKIYSIGYESKNENRDGGWRNLNVKIKTHPNLTAQTRRGYYAN